MMIQFPGLKGLFRTGSSPMKILLKSKGVIEVKDALFVIDVV